MARSQRAAIRQVVPHPGARRQLPGRTGHGYPTWRAIRYRHRPAGIPGPRANRDYLVPARARLHRHEMAQRGRQIPHLGRRDADRRHTSPGQNRPRHARPAVSACAAPMGIQPCPPRRRHAARDPCSPCPGSARSSLPLTALDDDKIVRQVLDALALKLDGTAASPDYLGRTPPRALQHPQVRRP